MAALPAARDFCAFEQRVHVQSDGRPRKMLPQEICSNSPASNKFKTHGTRSRIAGALPSRRSRSLERTFRPALRSGGTVRISALPGFFARRLRGDLSGSFFVRHQKSPFFSGRKPVPDVAVPHRGEQGARFSRETPRGQTRRRADTISLQAENPETGLPPDPPDPSPSPDENLMNAEQMALVRESLDQLPGRAAKSSSCAISAI